MHDEPYWSVENHYLGAFVIRNQVRHVLPWSIQGTYKLPLGSRSLPTPLAAQVLNVEISGALRGNIRVFIGPEGAFGGPGGWRRLTAAGHGKQASALACLRWSEGITQWKANKTARRLRPCGRRMGPMKAKSIFRGRRCDFFGQAARTRRAVLSHTALLSKLRLVEVGRLCARHADRDSLRTDDLFTTLEDGAPILESCLALSQAKSKIYLHKAGMHRGRLWTFCIPRIRERPHAS